MITTTPNEKQTKLVYEKPEIVCVDLDSVAKSMELRAGSLLYYVSGGCNGFCYTGSTLCGT